MLCQLLNSLYNATVWPDYFRFTVFLAKYSFSIRLELFFLKSAVRRKKRPVILKRFKRFQLKP